MCLESLFGEKKLKPAIDEQFLTPQQVSEWLQIKLSTVYKWTHVGYIPYIKLGGKIKGSVRFDRLELERWLKRRSRRGRSSYRMNNDIDTAVPTFTGEYNVSA